MYDHNFSYFGSKFIQANFSKAFFILKLALVWIFTTHQVLNVKMVANFKVFKKCSPNGKLTLYMGKRDFVDYVTGVEPIGKLS